MDLSQAQVDADQRDGFLVIERAERIGRMTGMERVMYCNTGSLRYMHRSAALSTYPFCGTQLPSQVSCRPRHIQP
jgi:hypothetical protein